MIHDSPRSPIRGNNKVQMWTDQFQRKKSWQINQVPICSQPLCHHSCELHYSEVWENAHMLPDPLVKHQGTFYSACKHRKTLLFFQATSRGDTQQCLHVQLTQGPPRSPCTQVYPAFWSQKNSSACLLVERKKAKYLWDEYVSLFALVPKCRAS